MTRARELNGHSAPPTHAVPRPFARYLCWLLALSVVLAACGPVQLVSAYDEITDRGVSDLHTKVVAFVGRMVSLAGKPEGTLEANTAFYDEAKAATSTLRMRANVQEKNDITLQQLDLLAQDLETLRHVHETGKEHGLSEPLAGPALKSIDEICEAIIKLEVAKRGGRAN